MLSLRIKGDSGAHQLPLPRIWSLSTQTKHIPDIRLSHLENVISNRHCKYYFLLAEILARLKIACTQSANRPIC